MLRKEFNEMLDTMSYEEQKEALRLLKEDTQGYDDSCNAIEVIIDVTIDACKALYRLIFK